MHERHEQQVLRLGGLKKLTGAVAEGQKAMVRVMQDHSNGHEAQA